MKILSIETSCDETSVDITEGRRIISNVIYSQALIHSKWGGVVPSIARRAHEERIDWVIEKALGKYEIKKYIDAIAVTIGPGLAPALEVGIKKAKELCNKYKKSLVPVNHLEGHIYSVFAQNSKGNPKRSFNFPYLVLLVSGKHTELVIFKDHLKYEVIGKTLDDAVGESLDKCGRMLGLGYPAGEVIERLSKEGNPEYIDLPVPMRRTKDLNFSYSGLKTALFYHLKGVSEEEKLYHIKDYASSFQRVAFKHLTEKLEKAILSTNIKNVIVAGGVSANMTLRKEVRRVVKKYKGSVLFPYFKNMNGDNAGMIGIAGYYRFKAGVIAKDITLVDRIPRMQLQSL